MEDAALPRRRITPAVGTTRGQPLGTPLASVGIGEHSVGGLPSIVWYNAVPLVPTYPARTTDEFHSSRWISKENCSAIGARTSLPTVARVYRFRAVVLLRSGNRLGNSVQAFVRLLALAACTNGNAVEMFRLIW